MNTEKRPQTVKMEALLAEYKKLKYEIFGDDAKFAMLNEKNPKVKKMARRYDQLFQFFNPEFRNQGYVSPPQAMKAA